MDGRQTPLPSTRWAIAHAIPVARFFAMSAFGPVQPPSTASRKICSQRSNASAENGSPVVGDSQDVGAPIHRICSECEVRRQQVVLHDVGVLPGDEFEDLRGSVEIASAVFPRRVPVDRCRRS